MVQCYEYDILMLVLCCWLCVWLLLCTPWPRNRSFGALFRVPGFIPQEPSCICKDYFYYYFSSSLFSSSLFSSETAGPMDLKFGAYNHCGHPKRNHKNQVAPMSTVAPRGPNVKNLKILLMTPRMGPVGWIFGVMSSPMSSFICMILANLGFCKVAIWPLFAFLGPAIVS